MQNFFIRNATAVYWSVASAAHAAIREGRDAGADLRELDDMAAMLENPRLQAACASHLAPKLVGAPGAVVPLRRPAA